jgi:hypothetical protein
MPSKRIGLEARGLARIFGDEPAGQEADNIAIPAAGQMDANLAGQPDAGQAERAAAGAADSSAGGPDGQPPGSTAGVAVGQPPGNADALLDGGMARHVTDGLAMPAPGGTEGNIASKNGWAEAGSAGGRQAGLVEDRMGRPASGQPDGNTAILASAQPGDRTAVPAAASAEGDELAQAVRAVYRVEADKPLTFRFAREENEWLETACFEISRQTGVKIHKQDLVRLGLNLVLRDYQRRGDQSYALQLTRKVGRRDD